MRYFKIILIAPIALLWDLFYTIICTTYSAATVVDKWIETAITRILKTKEPRWK